MTLVNGTSTSHDIAIENGCIWTIFLSCAVGAVYTYFLGAWVLKQPEGTPEMRKVSSAIREGASAFVRVQYTYMAKVALPFGFLLFIVYAWVRSEEGVQANKYAIGLWTMVAFYLGAFFSALTGVLGMWISVQTNVRATAAADISTDQCLKTCFRGGAFNGMLIVTLSVLGVVCSYCFVRNTFGLPAEQVPFLLVGLGFGASFIALFAQLGGGIYTKAADVGADLVGKVENDIPEDDPRNPAVIADLVGDNVGDCAGRGADLYESMTAENIGAMILGGTVARLCPDIDSKSGFLLFPLIVRCAGMFASMIAILCVKLYKKPKVYGRGTEVEDLIDESSTNSNSSTSPSSSSRLDNKHFEPKEVKSKRDVDEESAMTALARAYIICLVISTLLLLIVSRVLLYSSKHPRAWIHFFGCGVVGIVLSWAYVYITDYYTSTNKYPVQKIARAGEQGHGPVVIHGLAVGMESTGLPVLCVVIALLSSYYLGASAGLNCSKSVLGIYGTACATMGMLVTVGFILAMDTFGPISDNAGGIAQMSGSPEHIMERTDKLDAVGNTTKALTKGYAVGTAGLATFLLFRAFLDEVEQYTGSEWVSDVNFAIPEVFCSGLLGVCLVFFFSALSMTAVGSAAQVVIDEVRRQFKKNPGILTWAEKPDYDACVAIVTRSALKEMILPGLLVVLAPIVLGLVTRMLGVSQNLPNLAAPCLASFLMCVTIGGILMGLFLNNAGGAWDNAKKLVATGPGYPGKHSESHRACVTGDTVGDPCKDTAGPSLHVLVKLVSTITLVLYPLFVASK